MKKQQLYGTILALVLGTAMVRSQGMPMAATKTYSGCIVRSADGALSLAHAMTGDSAMGMKDEMMDHGMSVDLPLSSTHVDLSKHVGHKVSVTGTEGDMMNGRSTFSVTDLKMVAKKCS